MALAKPRRTIDVRTNGREIYPGDIAIHAGHYVRVLDHMPAVRALGVVIQPRVIVQRLETERGEVAYRSGLLVPTKDTGRMWLLARAKTVVDRGETRWVVDKHTGEMLRVATRYDVWLFENPERDELGDLRKRFALEEGVAWMTGT